MRGQKRLELKSNLKDLVYDTIINNIILNKYTGNQILNEQQLVKELGISKSPVREALLILCNEGILKNIPRFGYQVYSFTLENITNILEFRSAIESYALKKSFHSLNDTKIQQLKNLTMNSYEESTDIWEHWEINANFHLLLMSYSKNRYAYKQLEKTMNILKLAYAQFYWEKWNESSIPNDLKHHNILIEYLETKNLEKALEYLEYDLQDFCFNEC